MCVAQVRERRTRSLERSTHTHTHTMQRIYRFVIMRLSVISCCVRALLPRFVRSFTFHIRSFVAKTQTHESRSGHRRNSSAKCNKIISIWTSRALARLCVCVVCAMGNGHTGFGTFMCDALVLRLRLNWHNTMYVSWNWLCIQCTSKSKRCDTKLCIWNGIHLGQPLRYISCEVRNWTAMSPTNATKTKKCENFPSCDPVRSFNLPLLTLAGSIG